MKKFLLFWLFLSIVFILVAGGEVLAKEKKERLAVLDLDAKFGVEEGFAEAISVIVRDELYASGKYDVMSRNDLDAVVSIEEIKQSLGCDDGSDCISQFGKILGAEYIVAGSLSKVGSSFVISLRMLDTEGDDAGVVNRVSQRCKCDEDGLVEIIQDVTTELIGLKSRAQIEKEKQLAEEKRKKQEKERKRIAEEEKRQKELAERSTLTVEVTPASAQVKILNIKERYYPGISLKAGEYTVLVEASGYHTFRKTLSIPAGKPFAISIALKSKGPKPGDPYIDPTTGMEFVFVKGGCYRMGDNFGEGESDEKPVHKVCVDDFYIGKYEVTQGEYQKIMGTNPAIFDKGNRYPVEKVSWDDTQNFITKLNGKNNRTFRLPTETEWEYAVRSGGKQEKYSGGNLIDTVAWYGDNSEDSTHPVGKKLPNGLGIYDMTGNVWEWCQDWYGENYYSNSPVNNPEGSTSGALRVVRGGCWFYGARSARATSRYGYVPWIRSDDQGFRLVLLPQGSGS